MNNLLRTKESIDSLFSDFFHSNKKNLMKTDIKETEKGYLFFIDMPGFKKEDIKVNFEDGYLQVEGNNECLNDECNEYIHKERYTENIARSYYVGKDINEDETKAELKDGVLVLFVPRKEETKNKKYIEVK